MKKKSLLFLLFITIILVIVTIYTILAKSTSPIVVSDRNLAFPNLLEEINDVGKIVINYKENQYSIIYENQNWFLKEKNNYLVPREKVRNFLLELTNLILVERKTKLRNRLKRLDLDKPSDISESRQINVFNKNGKLIASGFIGKRKYFLYVDGRSGTYIRLNNELQTWLAEGEMNFGFYPRDWLDKKVFDFNPKDVSNITIFHADGSTTESLRKNSESKMSLLNIDPNREFKTDNEGDRLAYVVENFEFFDVYPRQEINFLTKPHTKSSAIYKFFDGFAIKFDIFSLTEEKKKSEFEEPTRWARIIINPDNLILDSKYSLEKINILNKFLKQWDFKLQDLDGIRTTKKIESMLKPQSN
ncbi:MAG: hypothetical protein CMM49_10745 [Rhodospirillaceae bacterium]|nr:hypothetical protein [Rhodospirillaceae bacterium]|tara:strand:+ start:1661 stop:2737 length:1077 start_codon:yes stop_codon:yes gene_type:complete